jgi:phospholipase C
VTGVQTCALPIYGWLRHLRGHPARGRAARPECQLHEHDGHLRLVLDNPGEAACTLTLRALRYRAVAPQRLLLPAGGRLEVDWPVAASDHWYDLQLLSSHDPRWLRRAAGHVETGQPSRSDPAFGDPT